MHNIIIINIFVGLVPWHSKGEEEVSRDIKNIREEKAKKCKLGLDIRHPR